MGYLDTEGKLRNSRYQGFSFALDRFKPLIRKPGLNVDARISLGLFHTPGGFTLAQVAENTILNPNFALNIDNGQNSNVHVSVRIAGGTALLMSEISSFATAKPKVAFSFSPAIFMNYQGRRIAIAYDFQFIGSLEQLRADPLNSIIMLPTLGFSPRR